MRPSGAIVARGPKRTTVHGAPADAPRYPFGGPRYWPKGAGAAPASAARTTTVDAAAPPWGTLLRSPALRGRVFRTERSTLYPPHLTDHRLFGTVSVPGASQTATVLSALGTDGEPVTLEDLHFPRALVLRDGERYELQITDIEQEHGTRTVGVSSLVDDEQGRWQEHLAARVGDAAAEHDGLDAVVGRAARDAFAAAADRHLTGNDFYRHLRSLGYQLGPSFRWIHEVWIRGDEALVRFTEPQDMNEPADRYEIHPGLLDSCLQSTVSFAVGLTDPDQVGEEVSLAIPFAAARLSFPGRPVSGGELWGHVRAVREATGPADFSQVSSADLRLCDDDGTTVLAVDGFRFRRAPRDLLQRSLRENVRHAYTWEWAERAAPAAEDPARHLRVTVLGTGDTARSVHEGFARLGHQVLTSGGQDPRDPAVDLVVDARFCEGTVPIGPRAALAAVVELARSFRAAPTHVPYVVLGAGDAATAPLHEALRGLIASLSVEQRDRRLLCVGLADDGTTGILARELSRWATDGTTGTRLEIGPDSVRVARLTPHREASDADHPGHGREPAVRDGALITGGLGALGLSAAQILARQGATALTLMGRSAPGPAAREIIGRLTAGGTRVTVVEGDVTDPEACRAAVAAAGEHAPLRTVLHLAGSTADRAFGQLTEDDFEEVFAAKAYGGAHVAEALRGHVLDALVLFSSASSVLGSAGQANYAAANGFLDGLAASLRATGVPATSVNWGPWLPATEDGLAASEAATRAAEQAGVRALDDHEAAELLGLAMAGRESRLVAVSVDLRRYTDRLAGHPGAALFQGTGAAPSAGSANAGPALARPRGWLRELLDDLDPCAREQRLAETVREMTIAVLGEGSSVTDESGFGDMGLDSIMVIDLRSRLSQALGVDLAATIALDHPTITRLSRYVADLVFPARDAEAAAEPGEQGTGPARTTRPAGAARAPADPEDLGSLSFQDLVRAVQADVLAERTENS
ncbi:SDR family NAD(P)-dependent oxidoreductase [Streptomyces sp. NPDC045714]|uniref:SDR family NAD(P)-dependent oxidoreductase n=1 Tax=Streptomyces sp. NPDC045714 TaxID=3154913 RepID=UPI0033DC3948